MCPGDYVLLNDVFGVVQTINPLRMLCADGQIRTFEGSPVTVFTAQQVALMYAERLMTTIRRDKNVPL